MKKVITYVRSSTQDHADLSLSTQTAQIREYCENKGYSIVNTISVIGNREQGLPILQEALAVAKEAGIECIIASTPNRLYIKPEDFEIVQKMFDEAGVKLEVADDSHESLAQAKGDLVADFILNTNYCDEDSE